MPITKPYDLSELAQSLKEEGLNLAEDAVKAIVKKTVLWVSESAKLSPTPYDDIALVLAPQLEKFALDLADGIDGQQG
jgi:hypothetical protein